MITRLYRAKEVAVMFGMPLYKITQYGYRMRVQKIGNRYAWRPDDVDRLDDRLKRYELTRGNRQPVRKGGKA